MTKSPSLAKDIFTLFTGNSISFVVPVLLYPVLSRIYTEEDYAVFGLYSSIFAFLEIASAGRYDMAIVMPRRGDDAINLVGGGVIISTVYSTVVLLLVFLFGNNFACALNNIRLANWLKVLPVGLLFISISKLCNAWLIRTRNFRAASTNKVSQKLAEGSGQIAFGVLATGGGLILGELLGRFFNAIFSVFQATKLGLDKSTISIAAMRTNLRSFIEFPKYGILPSMLNALSGMLPVIIISRYYSLEISGSYNFSRIMLSIPFALIAVGISQVLMQRVSERKNEGKSITAEISMVAVKLFGVGLAMTIIVFFAGPALFEIVFGHRWRVAGEYTAILILSTAVSLVVSPFSILLSVLGHIKLNGYWQVFNFIAVSSLWLLIDVDIKNFLLVYVGIDFFSYSIYGCLIYVVVRNYDNTVKIKS